MFSLDFLSSFLVCTYFYCFCFSTIFFSNFFSLLDAKKFKEAFEKSLKDIENIIGLKESDPDADESKTLADELSKLQVASKKADEEENERKLNGHDEKVDKEKEKVEVLEGKESED